MTDLEARCMALADLRSIRTVRLPRPEPRDEAEFMAQVISFAKSLGWSVYHTHDSRRSDAGFPDFVMVHPGRGKVIVAELKTRTGKVKEAQDKWLEEFRAARVPAFVWRPADWDSIERVLGGV